MGMREIIPISHTSRALPTCASPYISSRYLIELRSNLLTVTLVKSLAFKIYSVLELFLFFVNHALSRWPLK